MTPVLLLAFNRPESTQLVLNLILQSDTKKLYVVVDGPRKDNEDDHLKVNQVRDLINSSKDKLELITLFRSKNLGCGQSVKNGISWFFNHESEGIIIEDDCLPDLSFFPYCRNMLQKYRQNIEILHIGGNNFQPEGKSVNTDYYFSIFPHIWGWATWSRAWNQYEDQFSKDKVIDPAFLKDGNILKYFLPLFKDSYSGKIDTWDYQWVYSCWVNNGLSITPNKNLVTNIGFGPGATHTKNVAASQSNMATQSIKFPLSHPHEIRINRKADKYTFYNNFAPHLKWSNKIKHKIKSLING